MRNSYNICFVVRNKDEVKIPISKMKKYGEEVKHTAEIHGVTPAYVRAIIRGDRDNKDILDTYNKLKEKTQTTIETLKASKEA